MKNYLLIIFSQINERQMTSYGVAFNKNIWTQTSVLQHQRSALNSPDFLISHSFDGDVPFNFSITVITSIPSRNSPRITFSYQSPMRCRANATSYHERFSARLLSWKRSLVPSRFLSYILWDHVQSRGHHVCERERGLEGIFDNDDLKLAANLETRKALTRSYL